MVGVAQWMDEDRLSVLVIGVGLGQGNVKIA